MTELEWKGSPDAIPIEAECIRPDLMAGLSADEIRRQEVWHGRERLTLGDFFEVKGGYSDEVYVVGDVSKVKWIGAGMTGGSIIVDGNAGMHLGSRMRGGVITVRGDCGDWVGAQMQGGIIHIHGNAGHMVGSAYPGSRFGCNRGTIIIHGSTGHMTGSRMRRGLIAVGGKVGDFAGAEMIAGTVVLFGGSGLYPGAALKRGSVVLLGPWEGDLLDTFEYDCRLRSPYFGLLFKYLASFGMPVTDEFARGEYLRYSGDTTYSGKGELLIAADKTPGIPEPDEFGPMLP